MTNKPGYRKAVRQVGGKPCRRQSERQAILEHINWEIGRGSKSTALTVE